MNAFKLFANIVENCTNIVKVFFCKYLTTSKNFWNNFDILSLCLYPHPLGWANSFLSFLEPKTASKSKDFNNNNWDEIKYVGNIDHKILLSKISPAMSIWGLCTLSTCILGDQMGSVENGGFIIWRPKGKKLAPPPPWMILTPPLKISNTSQTPFRHL